MLLQRQVSLPEEDPIRKKERKTTKLAVNEEE